MQLLVVFLTFSKGCIVSILIADAFVTYVQLSPLLIFNLHHHEAVFDKQLLRFRESRPPTQKRLKVRGHFMEVFEYFFF